MKISGSKDNELAKSGYKGRHFSLVETESVSGLAILSAFGELTSRNLALLVNVHA